MQIPNCERAIVDIVKLRDYCLNLDHVRGRHIVRSLWIIRSLEDVPRLTSCYVL